MHGSYTVYHRLARTLIAVVGALGVAVGAMPAVSDTSQGLSLLKKATFTLNQVPRNWDDFLWMSDHSWLIITAQRQPHQVRSAYSVFNLLNRKGRPLHSLTRSLNTDANGKSLHEPWNIISVSPAGHVLLASRSTTIAVFTTAGTRLRIWTNRVGGAVYKWFSDGTRWAEFRPSYGGETISDVIVHGIHNGPDDYRVALSQAVSLSPRAAETSVITRSARVIAVGGHNAGSMSGRIPVLSFLMLNISNERLENREIEVKSPAGDYVAEVSINSAGDRVAWLSSSAADVDGRVRWSLRVGNLHNSPMQLIGTLTSNVGTIPLKSLVWTPGGTSLSFFHSGKYYIVKVPTP